MHALGEPGAQDDGGEMSKDRRSERSQRRHAAVTRAVERYQVQWDRFPAWLYRPVAQIVPMQRRTVQGCGMMQPIVGGWDKDTWEENGNH